MGQCHEIFSFWFFSWISFPQAPEYTIRAVSNFFENSQSYLQLKVDHRYQRHQWQICHQCQRHRRQNCRRCRWYWWQICHRCRWYRRQFCRRCRWHWWQILPPVSRVLLIPVANLPLVSTIPAANFPTVSTMPVANCHRYQRHWQQICHRCRWLYYPKVSQQIIKIFLIEGLSHLPPVSTTPVVNLELRISP